MRKSLYFSLVILFIFSSCGKARIDLISKNSGLILPANYSIIENKTESSGIQDYEINVILKFNEKQFEEIIKQTDSLSKVNSNWKKNEFSFDYLNQSNNSEPEEMKIDIQKRELHFNLIHI